MKFRFTLLVAMLMTIVLAGPAQAVTVSWESGEGFVGKGEVQQAYGWNAKRMNQEEGNIDFWMKTVETYLARCGPSFFRVTVERHDLLASALGTQTRFNKKKTEHVTGFFLEGSEGSPLSIDTRGCLIGTYQELGLLETEHTLFVYRQNEYSGIIGTLATLASNRVVHSELVPGPYVP